MSKNKTDKKQLKDLYIEDLGNVTGGVEPVPTTHAIGEECGNGGPTTLAIGEECDDDPTTKHLGEEDMATTMALGEECGDDLI